MLAPPQKVETADFYLMTALRKAKQELNQVHFKTPYKLQKYKQLEKNLLRLLKQHLNPPLQTLVKSYPSLDSLNEFYTQLTQATLDLSKLKKALATLHWAQGKITELIKIYTYKIEKSTDLEQPKKQTQMCLGRIKSVLQRAPLAYLEECRKIIRNYPTIKEIYTVSIAGFPNVGKSTLLSKLTTAKPEIQSYAFTTKQLNIGYYTKHPYTLQIIDTPGTLKRFEKMNAIEQQAYLAMKYASDLILYVYDLTETSYPLAQQEKLHQHLLELDKPLLIYLSKTDLLDSETIRQFLNKYPTAFYTIEQAKEQVLQQAKK